MSYEHIKHRRPRGWLNSSYSFLNLQEKWKTQLHGSKKYSKAWKWQTLDWCKPGTGQDSVVGVKDPPQDFGRRAAERSKRSYGFWQGTKLQGKDHWRRTELLLCIGSTLNYMCCSWRRGLCYQCMNLSQSTPIYVQKHYNVYNNHNIPCTQSTLILVQRIVKTVTNYYLLRKTFKCFSSLNNIYNLINIPNEYIYIVALYH